ncbi:hypothetical protein H8S90_03800 [Olivibacter sp. SDN3]|uniref:hypothetical protein n=1 Tax=Olivibacter sp. SDN3 TaxID=2764720 RepID=UPI001651837F|nr:hypothetical protein [Olivibacter sp. SDN3]QNL50733.1 hypothetical protein H8S90_03800 [Olivibacter sp. SDN3]
MNNVIVRFILLFRPIFRNLGVDVQQLKIILLTKLTMDDRRPLTGFGGQKKASRYSSWINLLLMGVMGCVLLIFLVLVNKPFLSHTIYFGAFMAMLCLSLISDFSVTLMDVRDNFIILPRPVDDRTFAVSRILHIGISIFKQVIGLALPGLLYMLAVSGLLAAGIFVVQVLISMVICILLVNMFYLVAMRFFSPQRFKDIVAYLQIVFSVVIFALYYTMPSILESAMVQEVDFANSYWLWLTPGAWVAALQELGAGNLSKLSVALSLVAGIAPIIAGWLIVRRLAPGFNRALTNLGTADVVEAKQIQKTKRFSLGAFIADKLTATPLEQAGFKLVWEVTARTREFKTKVYPSMAYVLVYFFFLFFVRNRSGEQLSFTERWQGVLENHSYLFIFYFSLFTLLTVFQFITQSEKYKAAWIYFAAPIGQSGQLMTGVLKAAFVKFYMPFMLVFTLFGLVFIGPAILNDVLLSIAVGGVAATLICLYTVTGYPFSQPIKKVEGKFLINMLLISLIGLIGFGHYFAVKYEWLVWLLTVVFMGVLWIMLYYFKREKWEKIALKE